MKDMGLLGTDGEYGRRRASAAGVFGALVLCAALAAALATGCEKKSEGLGKDVLATVAGEPITVDEFRSEAGVSEKVEQRRAELAALINTRLAAKEALANGMLGDPEVYSKVEKYYSERLPSILAKKVADEVVVTDDEVSINTKDKKPAMLVSVVVTQELDEAQAALGDIKKGTDFETAAGKSSLLHLYKDVEVKLDDALYPVGVRAVLNGLKPGEVSPVMKMEMGYAIFKLRGRVEAAELRVAAEKDTRARLMKEKADRGMADMLDRLRRTADIKFKKQVQPDGETLYVGAVVNGTNVTLNPEILNKAKGDPHAPHVSMTVKTLQDALGKAIDRFLLASEAKRLGLQYDPDFQKELALEKRDILAGVYVGRQLDAIKLTPKDIQDYFNKNKARFATQQEVRVSRILLPTADEAYAAFNELKAGKPFAVVAKERSTDESSRLKGGDSGYVVVEDLRDNLRKALGSLKAGEHTGVVKTDYGFEIIAVTEVKPSRVPELKELNDTISKRVILYKRGDMLEEIYGALRKKYPVKVDDALLKSLK